MVKSVTVSVFLLLFGVGFLGCSDSDRSKSFPPGFQVTTTNLPTSSVGAVLSETLATQNGQAPYTWALASGSLPQGVGVSQTGVLGGNVGTSGSFSFRVRVTDGAGTQAERDLALLVTAQPVRWNAGSPFNPGTVGQQYGGNLNQSVTGGTAPITFSVVSGALPSGIMLDGTTGAVIGTPTTAGNFSVSVRAISAPDLVTGGRSQAEFGTFFLVN